MNFDYDGDDNDNRGNDDDDGDDKILLLLLVQPLSTMSTYTLFSFEHETCSEHTPTLKYSMFSFDRIINYIHTHTTIQCFRNPSVNPNLCVHQYNYILVLYIHVCVFENIIKRSLWKPFKYCRYDTESTVQALSYTRCEGRLYSKCVI